MRTFTALFDTREEALAVQSQLTDFGVFDADRVGLHDKDNPASPWTSAHNAVPPEEDRRLYEESVRRGGFLLTVNVDDEYADRVHDVLENSAAVDVDERERHYREAGYMAAPVPTPAIEEEPSAPAEIAPQPAPVRAAVADDSIPVVEEQLRVGKRETERGAVRLRSYVVEQAVHEQVALREEHVEIERRPVNQPITNADELLQERTVELTERAEEAVVTKEAFVREEVSLRKAVTERTEEIEDTVRRTEVDVEGAETPPRP